MLKKIIILVNIISLSLQMDHCLRTYEICTKCKSGYYIVRNEWQYTCSNLENCLVPVGNNCGECTVGYSLDVNNLCVKNGFIDNCRNYNANEANKCTECIDGYALSKDNTSCIEYENCRQVDDKNNCKLCAKHYMFDQDGKCIKSLCEEEKDGECLVCTEGYFLANGECEAIPIDFCSKYEYEKCTECFHFSKYNEIQDECTLDKLISGCNKVEDEDDTICNHCSLGYKLSTDKKKCELENCESIEEVCYQCEKGFYIADNGKSCANVIDEEIDNDLSSYLRIAIYGLFTLLLAL